MYKQNLNTMKKIFGLVAVVAIAALNVVVSNNNKEAELSDLTLENIEASALVSWTEGPIVYKFTDHNGTVRYKICPGGTRDYGCQFSVPKGDVYKGNGVYAETRVRP